MTSRTFLCVASTACVLAAAVSVWPGNGDAAPPAPPNSQTWTFDRLDKIGGHKPTLAGEPRVIDTPLGKAVEFDGVDDALFFDVHPLAGAETFTWEAVFRPDGGAEEQRWFHLNETPAAGADTENRMLFEIRVVDGQWCLDTFVEAATPARHCSTGVTFIRSAPGTTWPRSTTAANSAAISMGSRTAGRR